MEKKDIVQGNLYQNKYDNTCIVIATHQEESESDTHFSGVNLSDGIYNFDCQLHAFDDYNKGKHIITENLTLKERIIDLTQKNIDNQREFDQRFCDLFDSKKAEIDELNNKLLRLPSEEHFQEILDERESLKKFIQHLQDYIAAKHLEENGLILEKYLQEENN